MLWLLPFSFKPPVRDAEKSPLAENLIAESVKIRNAFWFEAVRKIYTPESYYSFLKTWDNFRRVVLAFVGEMGNGTRKNLQGGTFKPSRKFAENMALISKVIQQMPDPPFLLPHTQRDNVKKCLNSWHTSFFNFFDQIIELSNSNYSDERLKKLAFDNLQNSLKHLSPMHNAFESLFEFIPDYFGTRDLVNVESEAFKLLLDVVEAWFFHPPQSAVKDVRKYINDIRYSQDNILLEKLKSALKPLEKQGIRFTYPSSFYVDYPLKCDRRSKSEARGG